MMVYLGTAPLLRSQIYGNTDWLLVGYPSASFGKFERKCFVVGTILEGFAVPLSFAGFTQLAGTNSHSAVPSYF